jgi:DNA-binding XRE family transcriptional regulator
MTSFDYDLRDMVSNGSQPFLFEQRLRTTSRRAARLSPVVLGLHCGSEQRTENFWNQSTSRNCRDLPSSKNDGANDMTLTGSQVREARELLGWTQDDLAGRVGVSTSTISFLENNRRRPADELIAEIRDAFYTAGIRFQGRSGVRLEGPAK